jgi:hypothetical protein
LERNKKIEADPVAEERRPGTFGDSVIVKFPRKKG